MSVPTSLGHEVFQEVPFFKNLTMVDNHLNAGRFHQREFLKLQDEGRAALNQVVRENL